MGTEGRGDGPGRWRRTGELEGRGGIEWEERGREGGPREGDFESCLRDLDGYGHGENRFGWT